ncbi:hypothetical protein GGR57DRAFT_48070 [Xylariaceae sp. FL1272]|nr:hypothetical protein GGR57DRAFT_48070 [Xylariaceae sp. FL1272]
MVSVLMAVKLMPERLQTTWQRWPSTQSGSAYVMSTAPALVPYDSTPQNMVPSQSVMASPFVMDSKSYTMSPMIASGPMVNMPPESQYQGHNMYGFDCAPQSATPFPPSAKQYQSDHQQLQMRPMPHGLMTPPRETCRVYTEASDQSSIVKSEPQALEEPKHLKPPKSNSMDGEASRAQCENSVDLLMKVIQTKQDKESTTKGMQHQTEKHGCENDSKSKRGSNGCVIKDKPHACRRKKCEKRFSQSTHLQIHDRKHTGEKPHICPFPECGKRFSQKGNLTSHERRHRGEKPFKCDVPGCNKGFSQKGNLASHIDTHFKRITFYCILKNCVKKPFSTRGNLKTHQNAYHKHELAQLGQKFSQMDYDEMSAEDKELWEYFKDVHKNSNKNIKGRGKDCRVELIVRPAEPLSSQYNIQPPAELQQTPYTMSQGLPHSMGYNSFDLHRGGLGHEFLVARDHQANYGMYEMDQSSVSEATVTPACSPGGMYNEQQHDMHYQNRMY